MERILEHLNDPGWWFTAVFIALLINLSANYLFGWIPLILSRYSVRIRSKRRRRLIAMVREVRALKRDIRLLVMEGIKLAILILILFAFVLLSFILSPILIFYAERLKYANLLLPIDIIQSILPLGIMFSIFYLIKKGNIFTRANYEIRRRYRIDHRSIRKLIRAPRTEGVV